MMPTRPDADDDPRRHGAGVLPSHRRNLPRMPGPDELRAYVRFMLVFYALFFPAYFGAGYLTDGDGRALDLYASAELEIPLVSWMILPYLSLFTLFLLPLFHMSPGEMRALSRQSSLSLVVGGVCFLLIPGNLGYPPREVTDWTQPVYDLLAAVDTRHNLVPSLHVAFAALIVLAVARSAPLPLAAFYYAWLALLSASTLLVHQHHVIDVVTGFALAAAARRVFPLPPPLPTALKRAPPAGAS